VSPGDSLAMIAEHAQACIPGYPRRSGGVARSMPTCTALTEWRRSWELPVTRRNGLEVFRKLMDAACAHLRPRTQVRPFATDSKTYRTLLRGQIVHKPRVHQVSEKLPARWRLVTGNSNSAATRSTAVQVGMERATAGQTCAVARDTRLRMFRDHCRESPGPRRNLLPEEVKLRSPSRHRSAKIGRATAGSTFATRHRARGPDWDRMLSAKVSLGSSVSYCTRRRAEPLFEYVTRALRAR